MEKCLPSIMVIGKLKLKAAASVSTAGDAPCKRLQSLPIRFSLCLSLSLSYFVRGGNEMAKNGKQIRKTGFASVLKLARQMASHSEWLPVRICVLGCSIQYTICVDGALHRQTNFHCIIISAPNTGHSHSLAVQCLLLLLLLWRRTSFQQQSG